MKTPAWFLLALVIVVAAVGWMLFFQSEGEEPLPSPTPVLPTPPPAPTPTPEPEIRFPVPTPEPAAPSDLGEDIATPTPTPLPRLAESDPAVRAALFGLAGNQPLERWLMPSALIPRLVATLDSLDQPTPVALTMRPLAHVPGLFIVAGEGQDLRTASDNARRYAPYLDVLQRVDTEALTALYFGLYPLFQQAYEELGYPGRFFNDRLVDILDHLLETPRLDHPLPLKRPKVLYQFADPDTEARSWGQKTLLRLGPEQRQTVMRRIRELRAAITRMPLPPEDEPDGDDGAEP